MYINDDANAGTVFKEALSAIKESARHIGKNSNTFDAEQIAQLDAATKTLQSAISLKKGK
jgi:hypothetical protein